MNLLCAAVLRRCVLPSDEHRQMRGQLEFLGGSATLRWPLLYLQEEEDRRARAREEEQRRIASDAAAAEDRKKKDMLLQMMKNIDNKNTVSGGDDSVVTLGTPSTQGTKSKRKDYAFRDADEKLHQGVPAKPLKNSTNYLDEPFDKAKGGNQSESTGYAPSFDTRGAPSKATNDRRSVQEDAGTVKKSKLLDTLFGADTGKANKGALSLFDDDDIFSSSTKAKPVADRRAYPWEVDADSNNSGKAKDEVVLMPLRQRLEPSAVHSKPTVKAVSTTSFEDDIEELVL